MATPPAFEALPGAYNIFDFIKKSTAPFVEGMLAPSLTHLHPLATSFFASSSFNSFCVAQGRAMSQGTVHGVFPFLNTAFGYFFTYSLILPLWTFFKYIMNFNFSSFIPDESYM